MTYEVVDGQTAGAPMVTYAAPQPVTYVTGGQTVTYEAAPITMADGQTMVYAESQPIGASSAVPITASTAVPMPMTASTAVPMTYAAPSVYNISPERFAQIAAGIPLTQEEINAMLGGTTVEAAPVAEAAPAEPVLVS